MVVADEISGDFWKQCFWIGIHCFLKNIQGTLPLHKKFFKVEKGSLDYL